ncbi:sialin isoform X2 [Eurytemora carolleeae]|uniref:sialin isoform X2 n=1 Tax=Eurytemora carolleeae TaxID=1294199 RepID=UPI000C772C22|nr:sialin isoform X2 [Eurytemora carolleeae]|eukprot:XP_023338728.1 sialin-like isoform X2 [Eurytemora affinis]
MSDTPESETDQEILLGVSYPENKPPDEAKMELIIHPLLPNPAVNPLSPKSEVNPFSPKSEVNPTSPGPPLQGSCRLTLTVLCFFGIYHLMALRFNISMGIVCMSSDPTDSQRSGSICNADEEKRECLMDLQESNSTGFDDSSQTLEFSWSKTLQGSILSSFYYGYIITQVVGGYTSDRWGGRTVLLYGMFILSLSTLFIPVAARIHPYLLVGIRIIQGLASGFAFPSVYNIFTAWSHPTEKATLMSISFAGIPTATVTIYPVVSWFCESGILGGWPMAFYLPGTTGLVWCILFSQLIYNTPEEHPRISSGELLYLEKGEKQDVVLTRHRVPWKLILRSRAVHCLWITHLCSSFGYYLIIINISLFIREALNFSVIYNGFLSMLPSLGMLIFTCTGKLFDCLRSKSLMSLTNLRKVFNSIAFFIPAACFLTLRFIPQHMKVGHVALLSLGLTIHELAMTGGFYFSHSDIGGPHSGVLFGITNTFAQIPGFLTPILVSSMTQHGTLDEWYTVFQVSGIIYIIGGFVYLGFGSSELEPWAKKDAVELV